MTVKGGKRNACAVCKYQRRKCAPNCLLAPYFPHDSQSTFLLVHRLYGVSNLTKILTRLRPHEREDAVKSIIYECQIRKDYPDGSCVGILSILEENINQLKRETYLVNSLLQQLLVTTTDQSPPQIPNDIIVQSQNQDGNFMQFQTPINNNDINMNMNNVVGGDNLQIYNNNNNKNLGEVVTEQQLWDPLPQQFNPNIAMQPQVTNFQQGQELQHMLENHGNNQSYGNTVVHDQGFYGQLYDQNRLFETMENLLANNEANQMYPFHLNNEANQVNQFHPTMVNNETHQVLHPTMVSNELQVHKFHPTMLNNVQLHKFYPTMVNNEQGHKFYPTMVNNEQVHNFYPTMVNNEQVHQFCPRTVNNEVEQVHQFRPRMVSNEVKQMYSFNPHQIQSGQVFGTGRPGNV